MFVSSMWFNDYSTPLSIETVAICERELTNAYMPTVAFITLV